MSDSVDRVFVHALNTVKRIPRTGSARPPPSDRLRLYGLYKQSTEGDVEGLSQRPEGRDADATAEREKWDAWHNHHGLSRTEAKRQYISTLIDTMHKYATTTPEARELVLELEFVWDQIKSNSASSTGSSPGQLATSQGQKITNPTYASIGGPSARGSRMVDKDGGGGELRVLRPVSDGDEEKENNEEEYQEGRGDAYDDADEEGAMTGGQGHSRDLEIRSRKWRKRIEQALVKMTTEVAAVREQIEAKRTGEGKRRNGIWAWLVWLVWMTVRHALFDVALLGILLVWARRKRDKRVEMGLGLLVQYVGEQMQRLLRPLILPTQQR